MVQPARSKKRRELLERNDIQGSREAVHGELRKLLDLTRRRSLGSPG